MVYHLQRHPPYSITNWENNVEEMKDWVSRRYEDQYQHLNDYYELKGVIPFTIKKIHGIKKSTVQMNGIGLQTNSFDGMYYKGEKFTLKWTDDTEKFSSWRVKINYNNTSTVFLFDDPEIEYLIPENAISVEIQVNHSMLPIDDSGEDRVLFFKQTYGVLVTGLEGESHIQLFDISGKLINSQKTELDEIPLILPSNGVYIIKVKNLNVDKTYKIIH